MIVQEIVKEGFGDKELYIRGDFQLHEDKLYLKAGSKILTNTYMNMFDSSFWKKKTKINEIYLKIDVSGKCVIKIYYKDQCHSDVIKEYKKDTSEREKIEILVPQVNGIIYFEVEAIEESFLYSAQYITKDDIERKIRLALIICTYKREKFVRKSIAELQSILRNENWLKIYVVDNASEIENIDEKNVCLVSNDNSGGSGGFRRGLEEAFSDNDFNPTHTIFMDDDAFIQKEAIYRLNCFLSFENEELIMSPVAGRMFDIHNPHIQYTAAEIWNEGNIKHIGFNQNMLDFENLLAVNDVEDGEYTGWWFACFPVEFSKIHKPFPFFLHCDDAEYGLRNCYSPIILNGIQVWHETAGKRMSLANVYFDTRNVFILNLLAHNYSTDKILEYWYKRLKIYRDQTICEYAIIQALIDFSDGKSCLGKPFALNTYLMVYGRSFSETYAKNYLLKNFEKAVQEYREVLKDVSRIDDVFFYKNNYLRRIKMSKNVKNKNAKRSTRLQVKPKISILVPCCNVEKYVEECLSSIVNQTLKEIEIICINDGSTDGTLDIINSFAKSDERIKVLDKPNSGYGDSLNKGLKMATGKYLGIVESDDYIDDDMFESLYTIAEENDSEVVKSNFYLTWTDPKKEFEHEFFFKDEDGLTVCPVDFKNGELFSRKASIWSAIYRMDFLKNNNIDFLPTPGASYQDTSFTFKVYSNAKKLTCVAKPFLHYRQDNSGSSVNNADKKTHCIFDEYTEIMKYLKTKDNKKDLACISAASFYDACIWMYELLTPIMRYRFLKDVSEKFKTILEYVSADEIRFGTCWWKRRDIQRIANDPYEYHIWRDEERYCQQGIDGILNHKINDKIVMEKTDEPFFSVIIPVYNNERYLVSCLDSLLFQTYENFEILCINDESTDKSLDVLKLYARFDKRIRIFDQKNSGPSHARNVGLENAKGKYILFLDSDDYYSENLCEVLYKKLQNNNDDAIFFGTDIFPLDPAPSEWSLRVLHTPDTHYDQITQEEYLKNDYLRVYSWRCCFKKDFIDKNQVRFYEEYKYGEDAIFINNIILKLRGISVISDRLYHYRHVNQNSLINNIMDKPYKFAQIQVGIVKELVSLMKKSGMSATHEYLEYIIDFVYDSFMKCPEEHKNEVCARFIEILEKSKLISFVDEVNPVCKDFINWCLGYREEYKRIHSLKNRMRKSVLKLVPPSRQAFYDYLSKTLCEIDVQKAEINDLRKQNQILIDMVNSQRVVIDEINRKIVGEN